MYVDLDIEKMTAEESDFTDFNVTFMQLWWIFKWLQGFSKSLYGITEKMSRIPYK